MWIINTGAFLCVCLTLVRLFHKPFVYTVPVTFCGLMVVLQLLAYYNVLSLIDWLAAGICVVFAVDWLYRKRSFSSVKDLVASADTILLFCICVIVVVLHKDTIVTNYDDFNYWAVSTKSLFFRDGIEPANRNVSLYYGGYPLGMQLIQWWFVHLIGRWEEKMLFIGMGIFLYSFLVPLFAGLRSWVKIPLCVAAVFLLPYSAYDFQYRLSPDACMGVVYAMSIVLCVHSVRGGVNQKRSWYYPIAIGLFCTALVMIKNVGLLWAAFVWAFWLLLYLFNRKIELKGLAPTAIIIVPALLMWKLWERACYLLERSTILVSRLQENKLVFDQGHLDRTSVFGDALVKETYRTVSGIKVPVSLFLYFLTACIILWFFTHKIVKATKEKKLYNCVRIYVLISSIVYIIVILYSVLTMFYGETQYENRYLMLHALILRYACPTIYGFLFVVLDCFVQYLQLYKPDFKRGVLPYILCISLLGVHVPTLHQSIEDQVEIQRATKEKLARLTEALGDFPNARNTIDEPFDSRVLYCNSDASLNNWISIGFLAEYFSDGTSVVYEMGFDPATLWRTIWNMHITHIYFGSETETSTMEYSSIVGGEEFLFNTMYRVEDTDVGYVLLVPEV